MRSTYGLSAKVVSIRGKVATKRHLISHLQGANNREIVKLQILQHIAMKEWAMERKPTEVKRALAVRKEKSH